LTLILLLVAAVVANILVWRAFAYTGELRISILPVEKGEAALIESPSGRRVLIGTGADASILRALGETLPYWERRLDALILPAMTAPAAGAAPLVFERYRIEAFLRSAPSGSRTLEEALGAATKLPAQSPERGTRYALGGGAYLDVLWPDRDASSMSTGDGALALLLTYDDTRILFDGDVSPRIKAWLGTLDAELPPVSAEISSSTPRGVLVSDGKTLRRIK
jgi:beta-lactamase superfamily II metal-dependent hydrolase